MGEPVSDSVCIDNGYIVLKLLASDSSEIIFKLKMTTPMSKLKKAYSDCIGVPVSSLRFLFDGKRLRDKDTPKLLAMHNDDIIEVYLEQDGGFNSTFSGNKIFQ